MLETPTSTVLARARRASAIQRTWIARARTSTSEALSPARQPARRAWALLTLHQPPNERCRDQRAHQRHDHQHREDVRRQKPPILADVEDDELHQPVRVHGNADRERTAMSFSDESGGAV